MLSVTCKPHLLSIVILNLVVLSVVMLSVVAPLQGNKRYSQSVANEGSLSQKWLGLSSLTFPS
jgi:hypothetical protein